MKVINKRLVVLSDHGIKEAETGFGEAVWSDGRNRLVELIKKITL